MLDITKDIQSSDELSAQFGGRVAAHPASKRAIVLTVKGKAEAVAQDAAKANSSSSISPIPALSNDDPVRIPRSVRNAAADPA